MQGQVQWEPPNRAYFFGLPAFNWIIQCSFGVSIRTVTCQAGRYREERGLVAAQITCEQLSLGQDLFFADMHPTEAMFREATSSAGPFLGRAVGASISAADGCRGDVKRAVSGCLAQLSFSCLTTLVEGFGMSPCLEQTSLPFPARHETQRAFRVRAHQSTWLRFFPVGLRVRCTCEAVWLLDPSKHHFAPAEPVMDHEAAEVIIIIRIVIRIICF